MNDVSQYNKMFGPRKKAICIHPEKINVKTYNWQAEKMTKYMRIYEYWFDKNDTSISYCLYFNKDEDEMIQWMYKKDFEKSFLKIDLK